jgi:hypothetical protein
MKQKLTRDEADAIAQETSDAYSFNRYGATRWRSCCRMLARRGYDAREIEAIMRSKWTRWAGDMSDSEYGRVNSADLARFLAAEKDLQASVRSLVSETF